MALMITNHKICKSLEKYNHLTMSFEQHIKVGIKKKKSDFTAIQMQQPAHPHIYSSFHFYSFKEIITTNTSVQILRASPTLNVNYVCITKKLNKLLPLRNSFRRRKEKENADTDKEQKQYNAFYVHRN